MGTAPLVSAAPGPVVRASSGLCNAKVMELDRG
jgi:hypothetical protein